MSAKQTKQSSSFVFCSFLDYFVRVYDGNAAYKRHAYRAVPFSKNLTAHAVLGLALKALHMTFHSKSFKICEISEKGENFFCFLFCLSHTRTPNQLHS